MEANMRMKGRIVAAVVLLGIASSAMGNLLTNPGFEEGDFTGWTLFSESQNWRVSDWEGDQNSDTWGVVNDVLASGGDEWRGIYQIIPVTAGLSYDYTAYQRAANVELGVSESFLELQWLDFEGGLIEQWQATHVVSDQDWTLMGSQNLVAPVGSVSASVRFIVHVMGTPEDTDWHIMDDAYFAESIPEPTTAALMLGGLLLFGTRLIRRKG